MTNSSAFSSATKQPVSTLEEAFNKLVDMNQLIGVNGTPSLTNTGESRKNPFEHILNPPKMPLAALAAANNFNNDSAAPGNNFNTGMN